MHRWMLSTQPRSLRMTSEVCYQRASHWKKRRRMHFGVFSSCSAVHGAFLGAGLTVTRGCINSWFTFGKAFFLVNHPRVISIFMGGISTIPSHGRFMPGLPTIRFSGALQYQRARAPRVAAEAANRDEDWGRWDDQDLPPLGYRIGRTCDMFFPGSSRTFSETIWIHRAYRVWFFQP